MAKALTSDYFSLFDLPCAFQLDLAGLDQRYRELQSEVHPDRFTQADGAQQRIAMQWATRVNEAYQTLKKPLSRAKYMLELLGSDVAVESNTAMPASFLVEQMEWREAVMEARMSADLLALENIEVRLQQDIQDRFERLANCFQSENLVQAAEDVRCLMFLEKLGTEINDALSELDN